LGHVSRPNPQNLANFFNLEIDGLGDKSAMEIEENVNGDEEKGRFSQIPFGNRKHMQSPIVVCHSSNGKSRLLNADQNIWNRKAGRPDSITYSSVAF
jgi:hypothetical protein